MPTVSSLPGMLLELHGAPLHPEKWQTFFASLCEMTGCEMGVFTTTAPSGSEALAGGGIRFDPRPLEMYNAHYAPLDPLLRPALRNFRQAVIHDAELVRRDEYVKTEFYNNVLDPFGLNYVTVVPCFASGDRSDFITLFRGRRRGVLGTESERLLTHLLPHMAAALETYHVIKAAGVQAAALDTAPDEMRGAAFVLDADAKVALMNREAESLLLQPDGPALRAGRLHARKPSENAQLSTLVRAASLPRSGKALALGAAAPATMLLSRPGKLPLQVSVVIVAEGDGSGGAALCLINDPARKPRGLHSAAASMYGLTPVECRIIDLLFSGAEAKEAAELLKMTWPAVRFHLKKIYSKTGTHKQAELMLLLAGFTQ